MIAFGGRSTKLTAELEDEPAGGQDSDRLSGNPQHTDGPADGFDDPQRLEQSAHPASVSARILDCSSYIHILSPVRSTVTQVVSAAGGKV